MLNNQTVPLEHIIGKIDNDFNPDVSDWIPRVGAWAIEAMQMLNVLPTQTKRIKIKVHDRIAYSECTFDVSGLKVYDENGCRIKSSDSVSECCNSIPTGDDTKANDSAVRLTSNTVDVINNPNYNPTGNITVVETVNSKDYSARHNVRTYNTRGGGNDRTYTLIDNNKIELNYDANYVVVEYKGVKTCASKVYGCEIPVIPNNALLIEAIGNWCMYKMLCRGYKHPVFNLGASQYGTNPYFMWTKLKDEAARSVTINAQGDIEDNGAWRSAFYDFTFNPKG